MEAIHGLEELEKGRYEFDGGYFYGAERRDTANS